MRLVRLPLQTAWRKPDLYRLAGGCGAMGVASLVLLAVAGGGQINWMKFAPLLVAIFIVIVALVFALAWILATLTYELDPISGASRGSRILRWPQDFPRTQWLLARCFIIAAAAIAVCLSLAWSGGGIWEGWNAPEIVFSALTATAVAIVCTAWAEAMCWLVRNWRNNQSMID
jgi:hypothetical protein